MIDNVADDPNREPCHDFPDKHDGDIADGLHSGDGDTGFAQNVGLRKSVFEVIDDGELRDGGFRDRSAPNLGPAPAT